MKLKTQDYRAADVIVQGHGSIVLLWPQNDITQGWFDMHVDAQQHWGNGIVVEPRYLTPILSALDEAGFSYQ